MSASLIRPGPGKGVQIAARDLAAKRKANRLIPEGQNSLNPSRQVLRAERIRIDKQPLGTSQEAWHKAKGFGKIGPGKRKQVSA